MVSINAIFTYLIFACFTLTLVCAEVKKSDNLFLEPTTLFRIKKTGTLRMITAREVNSYEIYQGKPIGFEYEMAREFADYLNVSLEVITPGWNQIYRFLEQDHGDFIAAGPGIIQNRKQEQDNDQAQDQNENQNKPYTFSDPYMTVQQKLIHHKLIYGLPNLEALEGQTIHVRRGTAYHMRLEQIRRDGINLGIVLHDNTPTEELIQMVADREIKYTVADITTARLNRRYHPEIALGLDISSEATLGWAVRSNDPEFLNTVNDFLKEIKTRGIHQKIYKKYYSNVEAFDYYDVKKFHQRIDTRLPDYQAIIQRECKKYDFDWRMIAAVVYQESHYNPRARSRTGVRGIMQVTKDTAKEMGISNRLNPEQSIRAGIQYLDKLYQRFDEIEDHHQRLLFALASYNIGYGHVRDAQGLAQNHGWNEKRWSSLEKTLPMLTQVRYYRTVRHGYARGWEPVHYIKRILTYYDILRQKT